MRPDRGRLSASIASIVSLAVAAAFVLGTGASDAAVHKRRHHARPKIHHPIVRHSSPPYGPLPPSVLSTPANAVPPPTIVTPEPSVPLPNVSGPPAAPPGILVPGPPGTVPQCAPLSRAQGMC
jgi:hypothetical protein